MITLNSVILKNEMLPLGSFYYIYYRLQYHFPLIHKKLTETTNYIGQVSYKSIYSTVHYLDMNLFHRVSRSELSPEDISILNTGHLITASLSLYFIYQIPLKFMIKEVQLVLESFTDKFIRVNNENLETFQTHSDILFRVKMSTLPFNTYPDLSFKVCAFEMRNETLPIRLRFDPAAMDLYKEDPHYYTPRISKHLKHLSSYVDHKRYLNKSYLPNSEYDKAHVVSSYVETIRGLPKPKDYAISISKIYRPLEKDLSYMTFEQKIEIQKVITRSIHVNIKSYYMTNSPSVINYVMDNNNLVEILQLFTF